MLQTLLMWACFGVGIIGCVSFAVLVAAYSANERRQLRRRRQTETDKAEITILFQTMRDVVRQQKDLARQFNTDLENKIAGVKQVLAQSIEKNLRLYENQQTLVAEIEKAKAALRTMQQQLSQLQQAARATGAPASERAAAWPQQDIVVEEYARKQRDAEAVTAAQPKRISGGAGTGAAAAQAPKTDAIASAPSPRQEPVTTPPQSETMITAAATADATSPSRVLKPGGEDAASTSALSQVHAPSAPDAVAKERAFEKWVGENLEDETALEPDLTPPSVPEDRDASRRAFQALLNLEPPTTTAVHSDAPLPRPGDNGARTLAPLQQRVIEYDAAGMSVAQIARELGIGKGEVRLMLSLARQKRV